MPKLTMVQAINLALPQEMARDERVLVMGEDVGVDGGVFRLTEGLLDEFGPERVIDTPLAESAILGTSIGMAMAGLRPVCEMQFSGFSYQAFHQIENHAGHGILHRDGGSPMDRDNDPVSGNQSGIYVDGAVTPTIDGNTITWKMQMTVPMPMTLDCEATIDGDTLTGFLRWDDEEAFWDDLFHSLKEELPYEAYAEPPEENPDWSSKRSRSSRLRSRSPIITKTGWASPQVVA